MVKLIADCVVFRRNGKGTQYLADGWVDNIEDAKHFCFPRAVIEMRNRKDFYLYGILVV